MAGEGDEPDGDVTPEQDDQDPPRFDPELAARFRAAVAYSGKSEKEIAEALNVKERTVRRLRSGRAELAYERVQATIKATDVPDWFMEQGFEPPPATEDPSIAERTAALESKMETVLTVLSMRVARVLGGSDEPPGEGEARADDGKGGR